MAKARSPRKSAARSKPAGKARVPAKDPEGGLTSAGRAAYKKSQGSNLKPGVKKALKDMTPEDMKRKGSFLRRHYANLRGPLIGEDGKPTRLALQAHAWGEPVPKTVEAAKKLAIKGEKLLAHYQKVKPTASKAAAPKAKAQPRTTPKRKGKSKSSTSASGE